MAKTSSKAVLMDQLAVQALVGQAWDPDHANKILDEAIKDVLLVSVFRKGVDRGMISKFDRWFVTVLPEYCEKTFKSIRRVTREDFKRILRLIEGHAHFHATNSHKQIPLEKQLAVTLYKFGNDGTGSSLTNVAALFGVRCGGTIMKIVESHCCK